MASITKNITATGDETIDCGHSAIASDDEFKVGDPILVRTGVDDGYNDTAKVVSKPSKRQPEHSGTYVNDDDNHDSVMLVQWAVRGAKEFVSLGRCQKLNVNSGRPKRQRRSVQRSNMIGQKSENQENKGAKKKPKRQSRVDSTPVLQAITQNKTKAKVISTLAESDVKINCCSTAAKSHFSKSMNSEAYSVGSRCKSFTISHTPSSSTSDLSRVDRKLRMVDRLSMTKSVNSSSSAGRRRQSFLSQISPDAVGCGGRGNTPQSYRPPSPSVPQLKKNFGSNRPSPKIIRRRRSSGIPAALRPCGKSIGTLNNY